MFQVSDDASLRADVMLQGYMVRAQSLLDHMDED